MTRILLFFAIAVSLTPRLRAQAPGTEAGAAGTTVQIAAGVTLPAGSFAEASGGAARRGAALSLQLAVGGTTSWITSVLLSHNPSDPAAAFSDAAEVLADPWWTLWPMTGIQWRADASPDISFLFSAQLGLFLGMSPAVTVRTPVGEGIVGSDRAVTVSAGIGGGVAFGGHGTLGIRYLYAKPGYDVTVTDLGTSGTVHEHQPTALFALLAGWTW